jgi:biotin carboxyl carrier protein
MPGIIEKILVSLGDSVSQGDELCILTAMKMENPIVSPAAGTISEINVSQGQAVKGGVQLMVVESTE